MNAFQQQAVQLAAQTQHLPWLQADQQQALENWSALPWPSKKTEAWMYTPLNNLQKQNQFIWASSSSPSSQQDFLPLDAVRLVFVNGVFDTAASSVLPDHIVQFSQTTQQQKDLIKQHLGSVASLSQQWFSQLNTAWLTDGIFIHIKANAELNKPIYLVQLSDSSAQAYAVNQRVLVLMEKNSKAEVVEHYLSADANQSSHFVNAVTEIVLQDNAELSHYQLHLEADQQQHIGSVHIDSQRHARFNGFTIALGSELMRIDYQCHQRGEGAELNLQGVYLPSGQQLVDYHTCIEHWVPRCTSNEVFRGIISDQAQAVFNGRIHIHPQAQKTLAELSNKNLLTSNQAQINTKPELEIYADDVKCAHGATVSQLNDNALYYLQSRGISETDARVMMSFGFINELLQNIAEPVIRDYLVPRLAKRFGRELLLDLTA